MNVKKKILIIGGAGYIGIEMSKDLIKEGHLVHSLDNLIYGQKKPVILNRNFKFFLGDICKKKTFINLLNNEYDLIVMLAGLVGDPITKKYKKISEKINTKANLNFIKEIQKKKNCKKFIFVSTCSNYGLVNKKVKIKETFPLAPLSLYAKSKVKIEKFLMKKKKDFSPTILRFATAFGYSERMRYDLTINQFVMELFFKKKIEVYDFDTWRPYCHIKDFSRIISKILNSPKKKTDYQVFNVGNDQNNFSKKKIAFKIKNYLGGEIKLLKKSYDKRNYIVNFSKLKKLLQFETKYTVDQGIKQIIKKLKNENKMFMQLSKQGNYILKKK